MCLFGPGCDPGRTAGGSAEDSKVHFRRNSQIFLRHARTDRKSTRLNSSHTVISYAVFCLKKKCTRICSTVLHIYKSDARAQKTIPVPMGVGHELVGVSFEVASNAEDLFPGQVGC